MKKFISGILLFLIVFGMSGCVRNEQVHVKNIFEETPSDLIAEYMEDSREVIFATYYEMSDSTWKTNDYAYQYRLEVTGRLHNAVRDTTYIILSNMEDISFEQAWKASGLSSNMDDYFKPEEAVFVGYIAGKEE